MHAAEVGTDENLVRRLLRAQFPRWADLPIDAVLPAGTDNAIYRLGVDKCVRLPRVQSKTLPLEKELLWLPRLARSLPLEVPVPLAVGGPGAGYPYRWAIYRWLDGDTASVERIDDPALAADDLGSFIAALQWVDVRGAPRPGPHNAFRGVPLADRDEQTRAAIAALGTSIDGPGVSSLWDEALAAAPWERDPVWIHGDLDLRNLLIRHGRICAVIDFGCLGVGDPACDVMVAWKVFDAGGRDLFRAVLRVDEATWARARGWTVSQALIALSYYTPETNAVLVREARRWIDELLAEGAR